ncbi:MAG: SCO family protein [Gammaproteobacteria bacterium]
MNKITKIFIVIGVVTLAVYFFNSPKNYEELKQSVAPTASLYPETKAVSSVLNFVDDSSSTIHLSEVSSDKWVLLYFGYTSCSDVCPMDLGKISQTLHKMTQKDDLQVVFVSVDPKRDIGKMNAFVKGFNEDFVGLSAFEGELRKISKVLGVYHQVVAAQTKAKSHAHDERSKKEHKHYEVDHTTSYLLLNPELALTAILSSPHEPSAMAGALDEIITTL